MNPRNAPLAAVEDLDRETEGGYAIPRDNVTPGSKVIIEETYAVPRDVEYIFIFQSEYAQPLLEPQRPKPRSKNRERRERLAKLGRLTATIYCS